MEQFSREELSKEIAHLEEALKINEYLRRDYEYFEGVINLEPVISGIKMQICALKHIGGHCFHILRELFVNLEKGRYEDL